MARSCCLLAPVAAVVFVLGTSLGLAGTVFSTALLSVGVEGSQAADLNIVPPSLPYSGGHTASPAPADGFSSAGAYDLSASQFTIDLDQVRPSGQLGLARAMGTVYFSVTEDTAYDLAGQYTVQNLGQGAGYARLQGFLMNLSGSYLANYSNESAAAAGTFILGQTPGTGRLSGTLTKGSIYAFGYSALIQQKTLSDHGATGTGRITLSLTAPNAVPLPAPLLGGAVLIGAAAIATRLRRRA